MEARKRTQEIDDAWAGPLTDEQVAFLRDTQAFIEHAIRNGLSFAPVVSTLAHDANAIAARGFVVKGSGLGQNMPKVLGYSRFTEEDVGEPEEPQDDQ